MTDDPLNRLVEARARAIDPGAWADSPLRRGRAVRQRTAMRYARATIEADKSLGYAVVPVEATEEMVCGVVAKWDGRKFDPGMTLHEEISQDINAAIRAGNVIGGER